MATGPIYIVHPPEQWFPGIGEWIRDVESTASNYPEWAAFPLRWIKMRDDHGFRVTDILSRVGSDLGPVLIFGSAQAAPRQEVKQRLAGKTIVRVANPSDSTEMWSDLLELRNLFASGEPFLPRRRVATMLIVRKLHRCDYWGGSHNKNFIWSDDIANGRGVDPAFKDIAQAVANFLLLKGILVAKYGHGKRKKRQQYALNSDRRNDIQRLANEGQISDRSVQHWFYKDDQVTSARVLDDWEPI